MTDSITIRPARTTLCSCGKRRDECLTCGAQARIADLPDGGTEAVHVDGRERRVDLEHEAHIHGGCFRSAVTQ